MTSVKPLTIDAFEIDVSDATNFFDLTGKFLEKIREFLQSVRIELPPKDEFLKTVDDAYEKYVRPFDIPGVPNLLEPWVDNAIKAVLLNQASNLHDYFSRVA